MLRSTNDLTGRPLAWFAAQAASITPPYGWNAILGRPEFLSLASLSRPLTDRYIEELSRTEDGWSAKGLLSQRAQGASLDEAVARCAVVSRFGPEVEVPDCLLGDDPLDQSTLRDLMIGEYQFWMQYNNIPEQFRISADELLSYAEEVPLNVDQQAWLSSFCDAWDLMEDRDRWTEGDRPR